MSRRRAFGLALLAATIAFALVPLARRGVEIPTAEHHVLHAIILAGGVFSAIALTKSAQGRTGNLLWVLTALLAPLIAMFLMWPSEYAFFETHPFGHAIEHLGLVALGFIAATAGERYSSGIGWATGLCTIGMALSAAWGFGTR